MAKWFNETELRGIYLYLKYFFKEMPKWEDNNLIAMKY